MDGPHAYGPIGKATAGLAGLALANQYIAAIVGDKNTRVLDVMQQRYTVWDSSSIGEPWNQFTTTPL
jgi:hypothetical protein